MRVFILGMDGYLGWTLAVHLSSKLNWQVAGWDNQSRRRWVNEVGSSSAVPIAPMEDRLAALKKSFNKDVTCVIKDVMEHDDLKNALREFQPDAVVHLAEMPSAPFSMAGYEQAFGTHLNNICGTLSVLYAMKDACPQAHLVKLGTMGEYGTPNVDIPEGDYEVEINGRKDVLPFPRQAGSWYHQTKVHDSNNVRFACKLWGLRATDIMQGVVHGVKINKMGSDQDGMLTRFDFDHVFGTVINRFCAQAVVDHDITPYDGTQRRGFLTLQDSMNCLTLTIENPPEQGEYRVFNQFAEVYGIRALAEIVQGIAAKYGSCSEIKEQENPRMEIREHYYNPTCERLPALGYKLLWSMEQEIDLTIQVLSRYKERINAHRYLISPSITWKEGLQ